MKANSLEYHRAMSAALFGTDSPATQFMDGMIERHGKEKAINCDEGQLVHLLLGLELKQYYLCPRCRRASTNPNDLENKYCGHCKRFENL